MKFFLLVVLLVWFNGCGGSSNINLNDNTQATTKKNTYGLSSNKPIEIVPLKDTTIYKPKGIAQNTKLPIVLFISGWESQDSKHYQSLLSFIASQGYIAIYSKCPGRYSATTFIERFSQTLKNPQIENFIDKKNIGVVGHSSGGGFAFKVLDYFSKNGYGESSRFIFAIDPWFAFDMDANDFANFPKNSYVIIQEYFKTAITNPLQAQDPRIALSIYDNLSFLGKTHLSYQLYPNLIHSYVTGNKPYKDMQIVLKPLDALMAYLFKGKKDAYSVAMENSIADPINYLSRKRYVKPSENYYYKCYGELDDLKIALKNSIDYCKVLP